MSKFDRIIGYAKEKEELMQYCDVIKNTEKYNALGIKLPHGLILNGMPGTGKTLMAECVIEECGLTCFKYTKTTSADNTITEIAELFKMAKSGEPSIIFFDDIEKLAYNENGCPDYDIASAIQSGFESIKYNNVFVIATSNDLDCLPGSLIREGRFDRKIIINPPKEEDAIEIIKFYLKDKRVSKNISLNNIQKMLVGNSCATLETIINEAGIDAAYNGKEEIEEKDIIKYGAKILFSRKSIYNNYDNDFTDRFKEEYLRTIAYHEAAHATCALYFDKSNVGFLAINLDEECKGICVHPYPYLDTDNGRERNAIIAVAGSKARAFSDCESKISGGTSSDLLKARGIIRKLLQETNYYGYDYLYDGERYDNVFSTKKQDDLEKKINHIMFQYENITTRILMSNRKLLDTLAEKLIKDRIITADELQEIVKDYTFNDIGSIDIS